MNWKFWKTENKNSQGSNQRSSILPKPRDLPTQVGMHLVTKLKMDPDWVWSLKGVLRPTSEKQNFEIRIFDPKDAVISDVVVKNFNSLDDFPEMILFEGCFNKNNGWVDIKRTLNKVA